MMLGSVIRENPLLSGIVGAVFLALVFLVAGALVSHLVDRRRNRLSLGREFLLDHDHRADRGGERFSEAPEQPPRSRRDNRFGFGLGALGIAFLIGLVAGGVGIAISSQSVATAFATLAAMVDPGSSEDAAPVNSPESSVSAGGPAAAGPESAVGDLAAATPAEVSEKLAVFAGLLNASLPRAAGPELSLTSVKLDGMRLSLGYAVARVMADDETKAFDAYITRTAKSLFCGQGSREIRYLNDNGVVFDMAYTDPQGRTVTSLTVAPGFCA